MKNCSIVAVVTVQSTVKTLVQCSCSLTSNQLLSIQYESEIESRNWAFTKITYDSLGVYKTVKQTFQLSEIPLVFFCSWNLSNVQSIPTILDYMINYKTVKIIVFSFCQFISYILKITNKIIIVVFLAVW